MSLVDFTGATGPHILGKMPFELDGLLKPLSRVERQDVRNTLALVARGLATRSGDIRAVRVRLDGVIAALISVVDAIDADCDLEDGDDAEVVCEDEGAQCVTKAMNAAASRTRMASSNRALPGLRSASILSQRPPAT